MGNWSFFWGNAIENSYWSVLAWVGWTAASFYSLLKVIIFGKKIMLTMYESFNHSLSEVHRAYQSALGIIPVKESRVSLGKRGCCPVQI